MAAHPAEACDGLWSCQMFVACATSDCRVPRNNWSTANVRDSGIESYGKDEVGWISFWCLDRSCNFVNCLEKVCWRVLMLVEETRTLVAGGNRK
jgi:hypothetical protein